MRVSYNALAGEWHYPLSRKDVDAAIKSLDDELRSHIKAIRFVCSGDTTREGIVTFRPSGAHITINFCTRDGQSRLLSTKNEYIRQIVTCGGEVDVGGGPIRWSDAAARRYALFILLHEIGHVAYAERHGVANVIDGHGSGAEEKWCSEFAMAMVRKLGA